MQRSLLILLAGLAAALPAEAQALPKRALSGRLASEHFDLCFRPGSRAAASVDWVASGLEQDFASITAKLALEFPGRITVFVYDDPAELQLISGVQGAGGFAAGTELHIPYDDRQTRAHELAHVIAQAIPASGPEPRSLFFAEGLANSLLVFTHELHCHAVAAFERRREELPPLADLLGEGDFYAFQEEHPDFFGYDVAASWLLHLTERSGIEAVKRYYGGASTKDCFGAGIEELELGWHARLDQERLRPELVDLMRSRSGGEARFTRFDPDPDGRIPREILGTPQVWRSLAAEPLAPDDASLWSRTGAAIEGRTAPESDWSLCTVGEQRLGACVLRATLRVSAGSGARVQLGERCQVLLVGNGAFLFSGEELLAHDAEESITTDRVLDLLLVRRSGSVELWIDGYLVLQGALAAEPERLVLGAIGNRCVFEKLRARSLP